MMKHILLATDFSARSDRAMRRATMLARRHEAVLTLAHVVDDDLPADLLRAQVAAAQPLLEQSAATIEAHDQVAAAAAALTGDPATAILREADEIDADLIILGDHRRRLRDVFVGTTAERIVSRSTRPVLIAAGVPTAPYQRALVSLDLEPPAGAMTQRFLDLGLVEPDEIVAFHAFDAPAKGMMHRAMSAPDAIHDYVRGEDRRARARLKRFVLGTDLRGSRWTTAPINGSAPRAINEAAAGERASLIVMGTSQRRGLERLVLGSVAEQVIATADRDVLVIPDGAADAQAEPREALEAGV